MRHYRCAAVPVSLGALILVILMASVSLLPAGKSGSARQGQASGGSFVQAVVNGQTFTHNLTNGELAEDARDALAALINADARFIATSTTVPGGIFEPDDVFLQVLTSTSSEISSLTACENDATFVNSGVHIGSGRGQIAILKPTAVAGGGSFNLRIDLVNAPDVDVTIITSKGDVSGLISDLTSALQGLGFTVVNSGSVLIIRKSGDLMVSTRVEANDTLIKHTCVEVGNPPAPTIGLPVLGPTTVMLLVAGLLLAGILVIWRKALG